MKYGMFIALLLASHNLYPSLPDNLDISLVSTESEIDHRSSDSEPDSLDLSAIDEFGNTPLHTAVFRGQHELVKLLTDKIKAHESEKEYETGVFSWAFKKLKGLVKKQLCEGLNKQNLDGQTPLHIAVLQGHPEILAYLLKQGADPSFPNNLELYPLDLAIALKKPGCICALLKNGGKSRYGRITEPFKGYNGSPEDQQKYFSEENLRFEQNKQFEAAAKCNDIEAQLLLIKQGVNVNYMRGSITGLQDAILMNRHPVTKELIAHGATLIYENGNDRTPLEYALYSPTGLSIKACKCILNGIIFQKLRARYREAYVRKFTTFCTFLRLKKDGIHLPKDLWEYILESLNETAIDLISVAIRNASFDEYLNIAISKYGHLLGKKRIILIISSFAKKDIQAACPSYTAKATDREWCKMTDAERTGVINGDLRRKEFN